MGLTRQFAPPLSPFGILLAQAAANQTAAEVGQRQQQIQLQQQQLAQRQSIENQRFQQQVLLGELGFERQAALLEEQGRQREGQSFFQSELRVHENELRSEQQLDLQLAMGRRQALQTQLDFALEQQAEAERRRDELFEDEDLEESIIEGMPDPEKNKVRILERKWEAAKRAMQPGGTAQPGNPSLLRQMAEWKSERARSIMRHANKPTMGEQIQEKLLPLSAIYPNMPDDGRMFFLDDKGNVKAINPTKDTADELKFDVFALRKQAKQEIINERAGDDPRPITDAEVVQKMRSIVAAARMFKSGKGGDEDAGPSTRGGNLSLGREVAVPVEELRQVLDRTPAPERKPIDEPLVGAANRKASPAPAQTGIPANLPDYLRGLPVAEVQDFINKMETAQENVEQLIKDGNLAEASELRTWITSMVNQMKMRKAKFSTGRPDIGPLGPADPSLFGFGR